MALDWGLKKIGVATVDPYGTVITPQPLWKRKQAAQIWSLNQQDKDDLKLLLELHPVGALVLGLPLNTHGQETPNVRAASNLALKLGEFTGLRVHLVAETLTSWEARGQKNEDSWAAAALLRDYLFSKLNLSL